MQLVGSDVYLLRFLKSLSLNMDLRNVHLGFAAPLGVMSNHNHATRVDKSKKTTTHVVTIPSCTRARRARITTDQ